MVKRQRPGRLAADGLDVVGAVRFPVDPPIGALPYVDAAASRQPSTGKVMSKPVAVPWAPIPAANPPAKSWAAASENRPSGSMVKGVTPPMLSPLSSHGPLWTVRRRTRGR